MVKIKNTIGIILLILLTINFSCTNEEAVEVQQETAIDLEELNAKLKSFISKNANLTSGRQEFGEVDEIINDFINDEIAGDGVIVGSGPSGGGNPPSTGQNLTNVIYRFYLSVERDHFYTTTYSEGVNAGYTFEGILGLASSSHTSLNQIGRWFSSRHGDRVLSKGVVSQSNHPAIALDTYDEWKPYWPVSAVDVPFTGTAFGSLILTESPFEYGKWHFEGIMGGAGGTRAIYGYYNDDSKDHLYTNDFNELGNGAHGYVYEGIEFYLN